MPVYARVMQLSERLMVRLSPELMAALRADADERGATVGQTVRWIVERYLQGEAGR